jgi:16S rRNA (cytidine1402-2'-O)-methyltransferase
MAPDQQQPSLVIVATPIGNLKDLTIRAQEALQNVDYVLCEDTRRGRKLKARIGFQAPLVSFHEHNEKNRIQKILTLMKEGKKFALISDAGSPLISDPGHLLIRKMNEENLSLTVAPGPSAVTTALVVSGLPPQPFSFLGFLPVSQVRRTEMIENLLRIADHTLVLFESPDRVLGLLRELGEKLGDREAAVCRELTKIHEEVLRGTLSRLLTKLASRKLQGEFTVVVGPGESMNHITMTDEDIRQRFSQLEKEGYSRKDALKKVARESGRARNDLYRLLMK